MIISYSFFLYKLTSAHKSLTVEVASSQKRTKVWAGRGPAGETIISTLPWNKWYKLAKSLLYALLASACGMKTKQSSLIHRYCTIKSVKCWRNLYRIMFRFSPPYRRAGERDVCAGSDHYFFPRWGPRAWRGQDKGTETRLLNGIIDLQSEFTDKMANWNNIETFFGIMSFVQSISVISGPAGAAAVPEIAN